jgi:hypothetical protein
MSAEPTEAMETWKVYICEKCRKPIGQHDGLSCTSVPTWISVEMCAVSPGCRGAELAEAAERLVTAIEMSCCNGLTERDRHLCELSRPVRDALDGRASGEGREPWCSCNEYSVCDGHLESASGEAVGPDLRAALERQVSFLTATANGLAFGDEQRGTNHSGLIAGLREEADGLREALSDGVVGR